MNFKYSFLIGMLFVVSVRTAHPQTDWQKHANNPVMVKSNNWWEWFAIGQPTCIIDNDTVKMWYGAAGGLWPPRANLFYAYSTDDTTWVKHGVPVLTRGSPGEWDAGWLDTPEIVKDLNEYKLYYYGDTVYIDTAPPFGSAIGLATSPDGINWVKHDSNPIFDKGDSLEWDGLWVESPALLFENDTFKMWYTGIDWELKGRVGYAISLDGVVWTKHPANPVVDLGNPGSWEDKIVGVPAVIKTDTLYKMWYSAISAADWANGGIDTVRIGYATSANGIVWEKCTGNPVLTTYDPPHDPAIDSGGPWAPDVVFDGVAYKMWYETSAGFCYATAPQNAVLENNRKKTVNILLIIPNPCIQSTIIRYSVAANDFVQMYIFDTSGRLVKNLIEKNQKPGQYTVSWFRRDNNARTVSCGVYLCVFKLSDKICAVSKIIVVE